ncbi:MAG: ABC transporter substrate-binding protein [Candidatus Binatia bacterium]|jgi:ABC-type nitrate/sulfonate/bicarbonate transport system substrate-binding protein
MDVFPKALVLAAMVFFITAGAAGNGLGQSQPLTAFYTAHVVSMAPMWIANENGLFKKHGADVRLVFIGSGPLGTTSILAGEVDIGIIGGFAPIRAVLSGAKNLVIIGQSKTYMVGAIVGKKEIAGVQDLKGKRLGIDRIGSNPDMYTQASLAQYQIDPLRDLSYIQMGSTSQGIPALKSGAIDAFTTSSPYDLFAQRLGFKVILDITDLKIPFAATVLISTRNTVARKQGEISKFMRAYAEAVHYYLTNPEGASKIVQKYTKVEDKEVISHSMAAEAKAMEKTLQVDPQGIELILGLMRKTMPQAASAKPQDFYDPQFFSDLRDSGFLKKLWGEK